MYQLNILPSLGERKNGMRLRFPQDVPEFSPSVVGPEDIVEHQGCAAKRADTAVVREQVVKGLLGGGIEGVGIVAAGVELPEGAGVKKDGRLPALDRPLQKRASQKQAAPQRRHHLIKARWFRVDSGEMVNRLRLKLRDQRGDGCEAVAHTNTDRLGALLPTNRIRMGDSELRRPR